jgi:hypothetical protein
MSREPDGLAELLPLWHRMRDAEAGGPLRALLAVVAEQADVVRTGVELTYENWFVETAQDWVLPYLGDLVGFRILPGYEEVLSEGLNGGAGDSRRLLAERLAPRRDVAATVAHRRRKGTLALLEELSRTVADWPARAVELSRLLAHHQPVRLYGNDEQAADTRRRTRGRLLDVRRGGALEPARGPFATTALSADVRRAGSSRTPGGWTPAGVGLFVWRLRPHAVTHAPAYCVDRARDLYTFSILGNDTPLVARPEPEPHAHHVAAEDNVPARLTRERLGERLPDVYGPGRSLAIWRDGRAEPVPAGDIVVADLTGWRYRAKRGQVLVDPELGRIAFGARTAPRKGVWVSYHHAFGDDLGGGEYPRVRPVPPGATVYPVGPGQPFRRINDAYERWRADGGHHAVIEITHSGAYQEQLDFELRPGDRLELRAAEGTRPVIRLLDWYSNRPDALNIRAAERDPDDGRHHDHDGGGRGDDRDCHGCAGPRPPGPRMVLDGLLVTGRGVQVTGPVGSLVVRHCTLVPGWSLKPHCDPHAPEEPSLVLDHTTACVQIERSILGTVQVVADEVRTEPLPIHIADSVLDATGTGREALSAPECRHAHAVLHARRTTVFGETRVHAVALAEDSLFTGLMHVARRGTGCLRFTYAPPGSRTPSRYHCQPDLVREAAAREHGGADPDELAQIQDAEAERVRPAFASVRYGTPGYARLADGGAPEIARGAEDGSEMGVFHDLFEPQREDSLRARLAEYTPAGTDAGIIHVT